MKRADMHAEIRELRAQRSKLIRRCTTLRRLQVAVEGGPGVDTSSADVAERRWISENVLRPGEKL